MRVSCLAGRAGIQNYYPSDFTGQPLPPEIKSKEVIRVLRPQQVVKDSAPEFRLKPITINHPPELVTAKTVRIYQCGVVDSVESLPDSDIKMDLLVQDAESQAAINSGKRQVSLGYTADFDFTGGIDDNYGPYDATMTAIRANHVAIVDRARAGSAYRLFDEEKKHMENEAIVRENERLKLAVTDAKTEKKALEQKVLDAETKIATLAAELETTKKLVVTDSDRQSEIDKAVKEQLAVIDSARAAFPAVETAGKSTTEIRLEVIDHLTGGQSKPDATQPAVVAAVYDALIVQVKPKTEQINGALSAPVADSRPADVIAREKMIARRTGTEVQK